MKLHSQKSKPNKMCLKNHPAFKMLALLIVILAYLNAVFYAQSDSLKHAQEKIKMDSLEKINLIKKEDSLKKVNLLETKRKNELPVIVRKIYNYNYQDSSNDRYGKAGIGDIIVIEVDNLDSLIKHSKSTNQNISLFVNGRKIDNVKPISGAPDKDKGTLQYRIERNTANNKTWTDILGAPSIGSDFFVKEVKISVGPENEFALKTISSDNNFNLIRIHKGWFWFCFALIIIYLIYVFTKGKKNGLFRDRGIDASSIGIVNDGSLTSYSLARFQMAFWFTLTIISFFFIWLITDAYDIITPTILALIGISAGTSLSAVIIDDSKSQELLQQTVTLKTEKSTLERDIQELDLQITTTPSPANLTDLRLAKRTKSDRLEQIIPLIDRNITILTAKKSKGFLNDVLTDVNGISFHRLQMLIWTFVLGIIFLYSVWKSLSMPDFSATLLALEGLTAGTYLGFKFPEKQA
ncbi:MAG: hypothetical protein ABIN24_04530 [Dyadobacter sp.]